jgi:NTE family protein
MPVSTKIQRLGLGLSGGGFRASFYHIGVLAQMAELGLLRQVEVISTVSGGSIIGALYYLHIKKLLEAKVDSDITNQDYVDVIKHIEKDFLKATNKNIRMSTFASFSANFRMIFLNYSRSDRIAELYNNWLYQAVLSDVSNPVQMQELKIYPPGQPDFHPSRDNETRQAKVPILVLNSTTLNTGRNWEFTAQTMGEPPTPISTVWGRIDKQPKRLRRAGGYSDMIAAPINQQQFPLGHAVAASACVPGLFDPLAVSNLYRDRDNNDDIRAQLVDGGVHDNQGIEGLLRNDCTCFVISDAGGQLESLNNPGVDPVSVLLRVSSILQSRIRTESLLHLFDTQGNNNVAFMNLRQGLGVRTIAWVDQNNQQATDEIISPNSQSFGIHPEVQDSLSKMRTDLDAFTEVEAYSLMLDGYRMSKDELGCFMESASYSNNKKSESLHPEENWTFLSIGIWARDPTPDYLKQLKVAQSIFGKTLLLMPSLWIPFIAAIVLVLFGFWPQVLAVLASSIPVTAVLLAVGLWLLTSFAPKLLKLLPFLELARPQAALAKNVLKAILLTIGTVFIIFYIKIINPLYLWRGRITNLGLSSTQLWGEFWKWLKSGFA